MRTNKKILSMILACVVVLGLLPATAFATEAECVYISASHDGQFITDQNGAPLAHTAVALDDLATIDLNEYGLSDYLYDADGDGSFEITALHLYIYTHEVLCGGNWGSEVSISGGAGSIYFAGGLFGFEDENLRYNYNGAYPADENGWGYTADQIVLSAGDYLDVAHFSDWMFYADSAYGFNYFVDSSDTITHTYEVEAGSDLPVKLVLVGGGMGMGDTIAAQAGYTIYYGSSIGDADGSVTTDDSGCAQIPFSEAGTYHVWCDGGEGIDNAAGAIVSSPASATVVVTGQDKVTDPGLALSYPTLSFEDEIFYNVYYTVSDMSCVEEMGLMLLSAYDAEATIDDAVELVEGYVTNGTMYMAKTEGIAAANMGDAVYFKVYAKLTDGTYAYSEAGGYNAKTYSDTILSGDYSDHMKSLVVAMVDYGAEAQLYFDHNTDALVNAGLTDEQRALVESYDETMLDDVVTADSSKLGGFTRVNSNFKQLYPSVSFDGAFSINYYCTPAITVDSGMTLYWWDAADYASIDEFTMDDATGSMEMTENDGQYWGNVSGIAAKDMDKTYYVSCVFQSEGQTITTGIISYSLGKYCEGKAATDGDDQQAFAQATAVYGYYAKQYFASIA